MANSNSDKWIDACNIDKFSFTDMLEELRIMHREQIARDIERKPYLKAHLDATMPEIHSRNAALKEDMGTRLLRALITTSETPMLHAAACDPNELWSLTGLDLLSLSIGAKKLVDQDRLKELPRYRASLVLKIDPRAEKCQREFRMALTDERRREFAETFLCPPKLIDSVGIGWSAINSKWTIPERNGYGDVRSFFYIDNELNIAVSLRFPSGLILPRDWRSRRGPLNIVDSPLLMLHLLRLGHRVICRQIWRRSLIDLAILLRSVPGDIFLLEMTDKKEALVEDAKYLSETLSFHLGRPIPVRPWNIGTSGQEVSQNSRPS